MSENSENFICEDYGTYEEFDEIYKELKTELNKKKSENFINQQRIYGK